MRFYVRGWFATVRLELAQELSDFYATLFSRKAAVPVCVGLCVATIVSFALANL